MKPLAWTCTALLLAVWTLPARTQSCLAASPGFHGPGVRGTVLDSVVFDDGGGADLYLAGDLFEAGGQPFFGLVRWDGSAFSKVGSLAGTVETLTVFDDGSGPALYAGGRFALGGGFSKDDVARWDGVSWTSLGTPQEVYTLETFDLGGGPGLYSGGSVSVYEWTAGMGWQKLGSGLGLLGFLPGVLSLEAHDDGSGLALYAGGTRQAATPLSGGVARWDGVAWSVVGLGFDDDVYALEEHLGELYAAGHFAGSTGTAAGYRVSRWDGSAWSAVGAGLSKMPFLGVDNSHVWSLHSYDDGSGPALYAGGDFDRSGSTVLAGLAVWDGVSWADVLGGVQDFAGARLDAVGVRRGPVSLETHDLGAGPELLVAGAFTTAGTGTGAVGSRSVARLGAAGFAPLDATGLGLDDEVLALIAFDAGAGELLYAGGAFITAGPGAAEHVAAFDGSSWASVGQGLPATVRAFALHDFGAGPELVAGGDFASLGHVARFSAGSWVGVGAGVDGPVRALATYDDGSGPRLIAAGDFLSAGGLAADRIAAFDGAGWSALGSGLDDQVYSLAVFDRGSGPELFAGGDFTSAGGVSAPFLAAWDGSAWSDVGAGLDGKVRAFLPRSEAGGEVLYLAGGFKNSVLGSTQRVARLAPGLETVGSGVSYAMRALAVWDDGSGSERLIAAGATEVMSWDGSAWSTVLGWPNNVQAKALAVFGTGGWPALHVGGSLNPYTGNNIFSVHDGEHLIRVENPCACQGIAYCTAGTSASGCEALISSTGVASRSSASGFAVDVGRVEGGAKGLLYFGTSGAQASPWGNGSSFQCVVPPVRRTGIQDAGGAAGTCGGALSLDLNAWMSANPGAAPAAGGTAWLQAWYRDPLSTSNQSTSLSNGLSVTICP